MKFGFGTICHYQNYDTFQKINTCISYIDMSPKDWKRHILHISGHTSSSFSLRRPICSKWRNTLDAASIYRFQWGGKFGWWLDMLLVVFGMQVCFCFRVSRLNGSCKTATHTSRVNGYSVFWKTHQHMISLYTLDAMHCTYTYLLAIAAKFLACLCRKII